MFSIHSLFKAVQSWRRRRGGPKTTNKRSDIALERLDHRQLMAVNLTGNAIIDIPATGLPGAAVVIIPDNPSVIKPLIPASLEPLIKVSGLELNGIRMAYTPADDILTMALQQPENEKTGQLVLAGDTDNNGNGATVDPAVLALEPTFLDFGFLGGTETMGAFLDLNNDQFPDVVAGISNDIGAGKLYQVADAIVNPDPAIASSEIPTFGMMRLDNTGAAFLSNDPSQPSFEFQVTNFSQLYKDKTGTDLAVDSVISVGAFGASLSDDGIAQAFFPAQPASFGVIPPVPPPPPPPPVCPPIPVSPPIFVNPHADHHVNTAHPTDVRVSVVGSRNFDTDAIIPASVRLGGAAPISTFSRDLNGDKFPDRTFIFRGSDINLPGGKTRAIVTGTLTDGTIFRSGEPIFNRSEGFYTPAEIAARDRRQARQGYNADNPPLTPSQLNAQGRANVQARMHDLALEEAMTSDETPFSAAKRNTVAIPLRTKAGAAAAQPHGVTVASGHAMTGHAIGTPAASQTSSESLLTTTAKRKPVVQHAAPVTVAIPRRNSVVVPQASESTAATTHQPMGRLFNKAGWHRSRVAQA